MAINNTYMDAGNTTMDFIIGINNSVNGWFGGLFLGIIGLTLFILFKSYDTGTALTTSGSITTLLSILLWSIGLLGFGYIFIPIAILLTGLMVLVFG